MSTRLLLIAMALAHFPARRVRNVPPIHRGIRITSTNCQSPFAERS